MSAVVPYPAQPVEPPRRSRRGAASVVQFASNGVVADVRVERVDHRNRCSWYAVKLAADVSEVSGRLVGVTRRGDLEHLGSVEVAPSSIGSARFAVTTPRSGAYRSMYLEIRSEEMLLRVEAPQPPAARLHATKAAAVLFAAGVAVSCVAAVPLAFARDAKHGASAVLGHAGVRPAVSASAPLHDPAVAAAAPARVLSFSARRDDGPGGESVLASYLAVADRGSIALLDASGTIVSTGAFTRVGTIRLRVPRAYRQLPMTAQITVHRGATKAVSSVFVPPGAVAPPRATASPSATGPSTTDAQSPPDARSPSGAQPLSDAQLPAGAQPGADGTAGTAAGIVAIDGRAVAGRPLHLRVTPQTTAMHAELEDASGATLAETEIAAGAARAQVPLPPATASATYLLALHYTRNGGEETVIRTVVAAPR